MTIWLAIAGAALPAPAQPPADPPDQAICELHVWPASGMTSIRQRASESNRMTYDLKALGVHGAIVGKAIYEGLIDLKAALNVG